MTFARSFGVVLLAGSLVNVPEAASEPREPASDLQPTEATPSASEDRYEIRQFPGGFMRFRADEEDGDKAERREGGVILVPADEAPGLSVHSPRDPDTADGQHASSGGVGASEGDSESSQGSTLAAAPTDASASQGTYSDAALQVEVSTPARSKAKACGPERGRLAQRLLELRGITLEPAEALVVLNEAEQPLSEHVRLSLFGLTSAGGVGGTLLESSVSHDSKTRDRLSELVRCLERAGGDPASSR